MNHMYDRNGRKFSLETLITGLEALNKWLSALNNEWGRHAQEIDAGAVFTNTIDFIKYNPVPPNKMVTYAFFTVHY